MKKILVTGLLLGLLFTCQSPKKNKQKPQEDSPKSLQTTKWELNEDASSIYWTGYKTTGKIPVKGVFQNFKIKGVKSATNLAEILKNAQVQINVYSIFSDNEDRDKKLIGDLFEYMTDTENIYARVEKITKDSIWVNIHMNAHEKIVPMFLQMDNQKGVVQLNGRIDLLKDFAAAKALNKFHKACFDKHTGKDGVSKTWPEVAIAARLVFDK